MKILYFTDPIDDMLSDMIFQGFVSLEGEENIFDYPEKSFYHNIGRSDKVFHYLKIKRKNTIEKDIIQKLKTKFFDLIIVPTMRMGALKHIGKLRQYFGDTPIVFIDGEDDTLVRMHAITMLKPILYFKREYIIDCEYSNHGVKILPISLCAIPEKIDQYIDEDYPETDILLYFRGTLTNPNTMYQYRRNIINYFQNILTEYGNIDISTEGDSYYDYYNKMKKSKICLALPGQGYQTLRYFEIPFCESILMTPRMPVFTNDMFIKLSFDKIINDEPKKLIDKVLNMSELTTNNIKQTNYYLAMENHTPKARADYIIHMVDKTIKGK